MGNIDDILIDLPARRDDEPESLRADIIDELTDHLQCAFKRELHTRTIDPDPESAARRRVLSRFGNPSTIAWRLWCDAMREKIMSQRIATGAAVVAAVACLGMFLFMWNSSAANREMLQQSQQMNAQLLAQMQGLAASLTAGRSEDDRPAEWNQLQIRCVADSEDGPPLAGVEVGMESASENTVGIPPATMTSDAEGIADFGLLLYGQYSIDLKAPNGMRTQRQISVRPGIDTLVTVVCPTGDALAELNIEPQLVGEAVPPESLRDRIWFLVRLVRMDSDGIWTRPVTNPRNVEEYYCLAGPDGERLRFEEHEFESLAQDVDPGGLFGEVTQSVWKLPERTVAQRTLLMEPGAYWIGEGAVCLVDESDSSGRTIFIPDPDPGSQWGNGNSGDFTTVASGETHSLTFRLSTTTFAMLNRILAAAPEMEVARLNIRADDGGGGGFTGRASATLTFGSRVALSLSSLSRRRRSAEGTDPEDPARFDPLLTGVDVIAFPDGQPSYPWRYASQDNPTSSLLVLLTPEERDFLQSLPRLYATPVAPDTERTSLDPAARAQLLEQLDPGSAESE